MMMDVSRRASVSVSGDGEPPSTANEEGLTQLQAEDVV